MIIISRLTLLYRLSWIVDYCIDIQLKFIYHNYNNFDIVDMLLFTLFIKCLKLFHLCLPLIIILSDSHIIHPQIHTPIFQMLPMHTDIGQAYKAGRHDEQSFIQNLSLFLCQFLRTHGELVEKSPEHSPLLLDALHYLILISKVDDIEIFKICLEYWCILASELYS